MSEILTLGNIVMFGLFTAVEGLIILWLVALYKLIIRRVEVKGGSDGSQ